MIIDRDTCVLRRPLVWHRAWLIIGVSLLLGSFSVKAAVAQLQLSPDRAAAIRVAKQASESPPDRPVAQEKNAQTEGAHSELIKKALDAGSAELVAPKKAPKKSQQTPAQHSEMIDQINAIRRQMGGGVAEQLNGLFDDSGHGREQLQREFERQLNELVATPRPAHGATPVPARPLMRAANRSREALRNAARELDSVAADLEDAELYQAADKIRANAANLRSQARAEASSQTANARQPGQALSGWLPDLDWSQTPAKGLALPADASDPKIRTRQ